MKITILFSLLFVILLFSFLPLLAYADSEEINSLINQSFDFIEQEDYKNANVVVDRALEIDPDNKVALNNKATVLFNFGEIKEAISYLDKALVIDPNYIVALYNKANLLEAEGNYYDAVTYYAKTVELDADHKSAKDKLRFLVVKEISYKKINAMVELEARDPEGNLIVYHHTTHFQIPKHEFAENFIKDKFAKTTTIQNSQQVEILQLQKTQLIDEKIKILGEYQLKIPNTDVIVVFVKTPLFNFVEGEKVLLRFKIFNFGMSNILH